MLWRAWLVISVLWASFFVIMAFRINEAYATADFMFGLALFGSIPFVIGLLARFIFRSPGKPASLDR